MPETTMTFEQRVAMFKATATDLQARADWAASRGDVILPLINEQSTVRYIFREERLAGESSATYQIPFEDIDAAWVMPNIGGIPTIQVEGAEIHVPTFGLDAGVEYSMDIAKDGRFPVAELSTTLLKNKFIRQEELSAWSLIRAHAATLSPIQIVTASQANGTAGSGNGTNGVLNIWTLNNVLTAADQLGIGGRRVTDIYVSPLRFGDLRTQLVNRDLPPILRTALYGDGSDPELPSKSSLRIHKVYRPDLVDNNHGYAFTRKDGYFYGVMPIRENVSTRDNPISVLEWKIGVIGRERLGFGVIDNLGLIVILF